MNLEDALIELKIPIPEDDEYLFIEEYYRVLTPITIALRTLETNKYTFGLYLPILFGLRKALDELHAEKLMHCKPLITALQSGFEQRFAKFMDIYNVNSLHVPLYLAMVSNPHFKLDFLGFERRIPSHYITNIRDMLMAEAKSIVKETKQSDLNVPESESESDIENENENENDAQQIPNGNRKLKYLFIYFSI